MSNPDRYAVFGHPINHSKSPRIHGRFAAETGQSISYTAEDVTLDAFEPRVREFFATGGRGLNCTVPLKEAAFRWVKGHSERALRAGAVNTLALQPDGSILGENTDGIGLVRDLTLNLGLDLRGMSILIIGAGGATRGILAPLLEHAPERILIANRTTHKAEALAAEFRNLGSINGCGLERLPAEPFDLILNATAASLSGDLPDLPDEILADDGVCYDLAYGTVPTPFVRWGRQHAARLSVDGLGMLVEQAAEAFFIWRGIRPDARPVIAEFEAER